MKKLILVGAVGVGMSAALLLSGCAAPQDTAQTVYELGAYYTAIAPTVVSTIQSGKLTATQVTATKAAYDAMGKGLAAANGALALCPVTSGVIDSTCANGAAVTGGLSSAQTALSDLATALGGAGVTLPAQSSTSTQ